MSRNKTVPEPSSVVLGIDIGGTGIKSAPVDIKQGKIVADARRVSTPHPASPAAVMAAIEEAVQHFRWQGALGCGFPGVVKKGVVLTAANLAPQWVGHNALADLQRISSGPANIINDADAAAVAEMQFGAGKPYCGHGGGVVMMVTLGTGIGTALFVDGHLIPNTELGHIIIDGIDIEKRAAASVRSRENLSWEEWGRRVGRFLETMEALLSPDVFVIGGGVSENYRRFFPFIDVKARLIPAQMGNDAGIVGAALAVEKPPSGTS